MNYREHCRYADFLEIRKNLLEPEDERRRAFERQMEVSNRVNEWARWSLTPHTEDEIREKILTDFDGVCFTYLCSSQRFSEEFIEELMVLSTGLLTKENYDKCYEELKRAMLIKYGILNGEIDFSKLPEVKTSCFKAFTKASSIEEIILYYIEDKLDWPYMLRYYNLSFEFRMKYRDKFYRTDTDKDIFEVEIIQHDMKKLVSNA